MSEYLFLLDMLDEVTQVDSFVWFQNCYDALDVIREGEDFLFFKMKESLDDELRYYDKHLDELDEIILVLDEEYAIYAYHNILKSIIETKNSIDEGLELEHYIVEKEFKIENEDEDEGPLTDKLIAYYTLPKGTVKKLLEIKEDSKKSKNDEDLYI